jgi:hypothetical protein
MSTGSVAKLVCRTLKTISVSCGTLCLRAFERIEWSAKPAGFKLRYRTVGGASSSDSSVQAELQSFAPAIISSILTTIFDGAPFITPASFTTVRIVGLLIPRSIRLMYQLGRTNLERLPRAIELVYQARYIGEVRHRDARSPEAVPRSRSTTRRPAPGRALV